MFNQSLIYIELALEELKSSDKGLYYLSFLKIRTVARHKAGTFTLNDFIKVTGLHARTAKTHLANLATRDFVKFIGGGNFKITPQSKLYTHYNKEFCISIQDSELLSYSWKNIASFRALLTEAAISKNRRQRVTLRKTKKANKDRLRAESITSPSNQHQYNTKWDRFVALSYAKDITGLSISTLSKYRRLQNMSEYSHKVSVYPNYEQAITSPVVLSYLENLRGSHFQWKGQLYIFECSQREVVNPKDNPYKLLRMSRQKAGKYSS